MDARIDSISERGNRVLCALEMIWQLYIGVLICMQSMANLELPPCKVPLLQIVSAQAHVDLEMENPGVPPKGGALHACTNCLST
jgi:hypothetical protein